jgi:hypothetical protein
MGAAGRFGPLATNQPGDSVRLGPQSRSAVRRRNHRASGSATHGSGMARHGPKKRTSAPTPVSLRRWSSRPIASRSSVARRPSMRTRRTGPSSVAAGSGTAGTGTARQDMGPGPRVFHAMAFDRNRSRVVLFGGIAGRHQHGGRGGQHARRYVGAVRVRRRDCTRRRPRQYRRGSESRFSRWRHRGHRHADGQRSGRSGNRDSF